MESEIDTISVRQMRLKILYTFDADHTTKCLARSPHVLDIQTAYIDDTTQIGVVELKACIQTVVSASPELVAKLDQDYTVYAYDYSESDTPLVGQGMLSWIMASASATPVTPTPHSNAMVTGLVSRSVLGLFSKGVQDTIEVKLRLVPVPKTTQCEYLNTLQRYREMSKSIGGEFDPEAWTAFVQANPAVMLCGSPTPAPQAASPLDRSGLVRVQQMLSEGSTPKETSSTPSSDPFSVSFGVCNVRTGSRSGTPFLKGAETQPPKRTASRNSRPSSRASMRDGNSQPSSSSLQRRQSMSAGYTSSDEVFEEGPAKKRAKVTKARWPGKSNLNIEKQPESLRVVASTAASVRIHRPIPFNPTIPIHGSNEELVRPPTPIPQRPGEMTRRSILAPSNLRRESQNQGPSGFVSTSNTHQDHGADVNMTSPEDSRDGSAAGTPANITSSPPVAFTDSRPSALSSPTLPPQPQNSLGYDSGFMSGGYDDPFGHEFELDIFNANFTKDQHDGMHFRPVDANLNPASNGLSNTATAFPNGANLASLAVDFPSVCDQYVGGQTEMLEMTSTAANPLRAPTLRLNSPTPRQNGSRPSSRASNRPEQPNIAPAPYPRARQLDIEHSAALVLPPVPASDPVQPHPRSLQRSQTWAGDMSDFPASDAPTATEGRKAPRQRTSSSTKLVGKNQTKARLESAISEGAVPPYCENCGTIETPAWRKVYAKTFSEGFDKLKLSSEEGGYKYKEVLETNETGRVTLYKAFKKSLTHGDKDFEVVQLCNPCGLWLLKNACMRPEHVWNKQPKNPREKKKRPSRPRSQRRTTAKRSGDSTESDAPVGPTDASSPLEGGSEAAQLSENEVENDVESSQKDVVENEDEGQPQLPPMPERQIASSPKAYKPPSKVRSHGANSKADGASTRTVQSSPPQDTGADGQAADGDLTPKPTRRLLFPSPRKDGEVKTLGELSVNRQQGEFRRSPRINRQKIIPGLAKTPTKEKENCAPSQGDGLSHLFDEEGEHEPPAPKTPTPTRRSARILLKTPSKTPSAMKAVIPAALSPAAQRLLHTLRTPKGSECRQRAATALLGNGTDATPFTLQLNQLLSDAIAKTSPAGPNSELNFDFPDLPSLRSSPNPGHGNGANFDFSEFSNFDPSDLDNLQELLSTDLPMPSSPPNTFFNMYEDAAGEQAGIWSDFACPEPASMAPPAKRVSPRRKGGEVAVDFSHFVDEVAGGQ